MVWGLSWFSGPRPFAVSGVSGDVWGVSGDVVFSGGVSGDVRQPSPETVLPEICGCHLN